MGASEGVVSFQLHALASPRRLLHGYARERQECNTSPSPYLPMALAAVSAALLHADSRLSQVKACACRARQRRNAIGQVTNVYIYIYIVTAAGFNQQQLAPVLPTAVYRML